MDTLDVRGLSDEYTLWLQKMVDSMREQTQHRQARKDKEIVFATHKSHLIGGYNRAAAKGIETFIKHAPSITEFLPNIGKVNTGPAFLGKLGTFSRKRAMYDLDTFRFEKFSHRNEIPI